MDHKDGYVPMLKIKQDLSTEIPEYLQELVEGGMNPEEAFELTQMSARKGQEAGQKVPDMKAVQKTLKNMERKR